MKKENLVKLCMINQLFGNQLSGSNNSECFYIDEDSQEIVINREFLRGEMVYLVNPEGAYNYALVKYFAFSNTANNPRGFYFAVKPLQGEVKDTVWWPINLDGSVNHNLRLVDGDEKFNEENKNLLRISKLERKIEKLEKLNKKY